MLAFLLKELFPYGAQGDSSEYEVRYQSPSLARTLFRRQRTRVNALLVMKTSEIHFQRACADLLSSLRSIGPVAETVDCSWLVCSDRGGIYLYEAIATKENARSIPFRNGFVIINSGDGTVSFGPGHEKNGRFSRRMADLLDSYRSLPLGEWKREFAMLVQELFQ